MSSASRTGSYNGSRATATTIGVADVAAAGRARENERRWQVPVVGRVVLAHHDRHAPLLVDEAGHVDRGAVPGGPSPPVDTGRPQVEPHHVHHSPPVIGVSLRSDGGPLLVDTGPRPKVGEADTSPVRSGTRSTGDRSGPEDPPS